MNRAMVRAVTRWASCLVVALLAARPATAQEAPPSSAIERALTERICDGLFAARPTDVGGHESCVADQLAALRSDFGRDLSRLSASDRRKLDATCSPLEKAESRERYLDCVNAQLTVLRERLHRGRTAPADATPETPSPQALPAASPAPQATGWMWWIAAPLAIVAAIAGAVVLVRKRRPSATHVCSACGAPVADAGALCAACRHEAAEARRRAAAERVAEADQPQRQHAIENAEREREIARQMALDAEAREREEAERRQRAQEEENARTNASVPAAAGPAADEDGPFDPYQILGIPPDADDDAIRAAYEAAKAKYDVDQVSHLSPEVQHHYQAKAAAVELAYQTLTAT